MSRERDQTRAKGRTRGITSGAKKSTFPGLSQLDKEFGEVLPPISPYDPPPYSGHGPKVLICIWELIQDLGGIINWTEHLTYGLRHLGASVTLVRIENKIYPPKASKILPVRKMTLGYTGLSHNQKSGWRFGVKNRICLHGFDWHSYANSFDLVIWTTPVPSETHLFKNWQQVYDLKTSQILVIHDGNLNKLYPHAYEVMSNCTAVVGVHDCAFNSVGCPPSTATHAEVDPNKAYVKAPTLLIPNPQILEGRLTPDIGYSQRKKQAVSLQTFKAWKHVDDLVRCCPYMNCNLVLAGDGMERFYMTSPDKRKPEYGTIWEDAISCGMKFHGFIPEVERDILLRESRLLVDPSWSRTYAQYGSHFNRTFVDGIIAGCLPAGRDLLMDGNSFFPKELYVTLPYDSSPEDLARDIDAAVLTISYKDYIDRVEALRRIVVEKFDAKKIAKKYLEFI